jgi:hypothetical protein
MNTRHPLTRATRIAAMCAVIGAGAANAQSWNVEPRNERASRPHSVVEGQIVDVQVRVEGATAPLYFRPGQFDRHYFQAFRGRNYSLVVRNTTGRRVGVLIAVDGINVVNGGKSRLCRDEPMYVLDPYERAEINGWRSSLRDVHEFVFVDEERSYAERTGQANGDLGWIRVVAYRENAPAWTPWGKVREQRLDGSDRRETRGESGAPAPSAPEYSPRARAEAAPEAQRDALGRNSQELDSNPGTGWGERRSDPVQRTWFEAERRPSDEIALRYEYAAGLRALGIHPGRSRLWEREDGRLGFAKPPRW